MRYHEQTEVDDGNGGNEAASMEHIAVVPTKQLLEALVCSNCPTVLISCHEIALPLSTPQYVKSQACKVEPELQSSSVES